MARVLGRIRLSRFTEEGTGEVRQREAIELWATSNGHEVIGWAVDLDVSGGVSPFEAPELGPYLTDEGLQQWDILCAYRLDRISRRVIPLNRLFGLALEHGKTVVSVSESIDLSTWVGRLVANVISGVAEGELEAITERAKGRTQKLRELGRYHGGRVPYGYQAVKRDDGWYLEIALEQAEIIREAANRVLKGEATLKVCRDLEGRSVPAPTGGRWHPQSLRRILGSRTLLGEYENRGRVVTEADGLPKKRAEAILSYTQWEELQRVLDGKAKPRRRKNPTGLLLNVAYCYDCGEPLYIHHTRKPERKTNPHLVYWRCSGRIFKKNGCQAETMRAEWLEAFVEDQLLEEIGDQERMEREWVQGEDHSEQLAEVNAAMTRIRAESDAGLVTDQNEYLDRLRALTARRDELRSKPVTDAGYRWRGLGETYREAWQRMDTDERRRLLLDSGIRVEAKRLHAHFIVPPDVRERVHG